MTKVCIFLIIDIDSNWEMRSWLRKSFECKLNGCELEQVRKFKYLGFIFFEDEKYNKEFKQRRANGNKVTAQLRSYVSNKKKSLVWTQH